MDHRRSYSNVSLSHLWLRFYQSLLLCWVELVGDLPVSVWSLGLDVDPSLRNTDPDTAVARRDHLGALRC